MQQENKLKYSGSNVWILENGGDPGIPMQNMSACQVLPGETALLIFLRGLLGTAIQNNGKLIYTYLPSK